MGRLVPKTVTEMEILDVLKFFSSLNLSNQRI